MCVPFKLANIKYNVQVLMLETNDLYKNLCLTVSFLSVNTLFLLMSLKLYFILICFYLVFACLFVCLFVTK